MKTLKYLFFSCFTSLLIFCRRDEKPSEAAKMLSLNIEQIKKTKFTQNHNNFEISVAYEDQDILKNTLKVNFKLSEKAIILLDGKAQGSNHQIPIALKKKGNLYIPKKNISVLAEDCLHRESYKLSFRVLKKTFLFPKYEKVFSGRFRLSDKEIFERVIGEKTHYYLAAISGITPKDAAVFTSSNKALNVLKPGVFTANLLFKNPNKQSPEVLITQASFHILPFEKPIIEGTPLVGEVLRIKNLQKLPLGWQWIFAWSQNGALIDSANKNTYTLRDSDVGKSIHLSLTLQKGTEQHRQNSNIITNIINHPQKPMIRGAALYQNKTITYTNVPASVTGWTNILQWHKRSLAGVVRALTITTADYILQKEDVNHTIQVSIQRIFKATGKRTNQVFSDFTSNILPPIPVPSIAAITGIPIVGNALSAHVTSTTPAGFSLRMQWAYKNSPHNILHTGNRYTLTLRDVNKQLIVKAVYYKNNVYGQISISNPYQTIINTPNTPAIIGNPYENNILATTINPAPTGWTRIIKWYTLPIGSGSKLTQIKKQNKPSLKVERKYINAYIKVSVQYLKASWKTDEVFSNKTTEVIPVPVAPIITGCPVIGHILNAQLDNTPVGWIRKVKWYYSSGVERKTTLDYAHTVQRKDIGKQLYVKVYFEKGSLRSPEKTSIRTDPIFNTTNAPHIVDIIDPAGTFQVGNTVHFTIPRKPKDWNFSFKWLADGVEIIKATKNSYTLTSDEKGKQIRIVLTYTKLCKIISTYSNMSPLIR